MRALMLSHLLPFLITLSLISSSRCAHVHHLQPRALSLVTDAGHAGEAGAVGRAGATGSKAFDGTKDASNLAKPVGHTGEATKGTSSTGIPPFLPGGIHDKLPPTPQHLEHGTSSYSVKFLPNRETAHTPPEITPALPHPEKAANPSDKTLKGQIDQSSRKWDQPPKKDPTHNPSETGLAPFNPSKAVPEETFVKTFDKTSRTWKQLKFDVAHSAYKSWNRIAPDIEAFERNARYAIRMWFKNFKERWKNNLSAAISKLKAKFGRASPVQEVEEGTKLPAAPDPEVISLGEKLESFSITVPRRPPTPEELRSFNQVKMQLANGFSNKAYQYALGDANEFTPHNFAELMKKKIPPKFVGKTPQPQPYEEYLNVLNDYNRASQTVRKAWMALATINIEGTAGEAKVVEELGTVLANVDPKMMSKFQSESQAAANGIERTKYPLPQKPASYLKDFKNKNYQYSSFPRARAIQLNEDIPKVPVDSDFSTVEEVIHALPPDLDLTTELYRYSLIKDFEDILLDNVRPNAEKILQTAAKQQIEESLKTPSLLEKSINSYISKLGEDDYVRFFGEPPASVYTKLAKSATPKEKILHALENYENLLHEADYNKLREASTSSDPRINFKRALNLIKQAQERQEPKLDSYIKILKEFEGQALNQRGTNYPYLDELFHRHMIDDATYAKLNSPEMNPTAFHDVLGTRPQFTKTLMDQFRKRLEAESLEQVAQNNLPDAAITHLTHSYFEQLDSQAKKFYLTTNAFTKPNSMKFGEAIRVYDESSLRKLHSLPPDSDLVAKSLVEAHLPEAPPADELEVFLNEVHLTGHSPRNYEVDHPILKDNQFPSIDFRLREFFEKPLLKDDARLIGTRYAHMSDAARQSLNAAANALFQDYEKLIEAAKSGDNLKKKIAVLEGQLREDIPPMLEIMSFIEHNKKIGNVLGG